MTLDYKPLVIFTAILAIGTTQLKAEPKQPEKTAEAPKADSFDALYKLRIEYFTKSVKIYESVKDEASAQQAAKDLKGLTKLNAEIKRMTTALGQPDAAQYTELNKKYGTQIQELSTRMMKASYAFASKPYGKHIHRAQLQMMADGGDKDAAKALKLMDDPKAMKAFKDQERARVEKLKAEVSPEAQKAGDKWLAAMSALSKELNTLNDEAAAKKALPKLEKLVTELETQSKAFNKSEGAGAYVQANRSKMASPFMTIGMKCGQFSKSSDKELQGVMVRALKQVSDM